MQIKVIELKRDSLVLPFDFVNSNFSSFLRKDSYFIFYSKDYCNLIMNRIMELVPQDLFHHAAMFLGMKLNEIQSNYEYVQIVYDQSV